MRFDQLFTQSALLNALLDVSAQFRVSVNCTHAVRAVEKDLRAIQMLAIYWHRRRDC